MRADDNKEGKQEVPSELVQSSFADGLPSLAPPLASDTSGALSFSNSTALVPRILSYNVNGLSFYASDSDGVLRKSLAVKLFLTLSPSVTLFVYRKPT